MLSGLLTFLLIVDALVLVLLIIALQHGNEGGIGSAFGSGNSSGFFGATGGVSFIIRATWVCGGLFLLLAMSLSWRKTHDHFGVGREINGLLGAPPKPGASASVPTPANPATAPVLNAPGGVGMPSAGTAAPAGTVVPAAPPATAP